MEAARNGSRSSKPMRPWRTSITCWIRSIFSISTSPNTLHHACRPRSRKAEVARANCRPLDPDLNMHSRVYCKNAQSDFFLSLLHISQVIMHPDSTCLSTEKESALTKMQAQMRLQRKAKKHFAMMDHESPTMEASPTEGRWAKGIGSAIDQT